MTEREPGGDRGPARTAAGARSRAGSQEQSCGPDADGERTVMPVAVGETIVGHPVVPPRQTEPPERRLLGKPLRWGRGWTAVVFVWLAIGAALCVARLDMGHLTAWSAHEATAVAQVRAYSPDGVHSTDELLGVVARQLSSRQGGNPGAPRWYAFERSWEDRVYVIWEWSEGAALSFSVRHGVVRPDDEARLVLLTVARSLRGR